MVDHNSLPKHFTCLPHSGGSHTKHPRQDIPKATATLKRQWKPWKSYLQHLGIINCHLNDNKLCRALLYTPSCRDGLSPAQKLYGHPVQDTLPAHHCSFSPQWQISKQAVLWFNQRSSITHTQTLKLDPALHCKTSRQNVGASMVKLLPLGHTDDTSLEHRVDGSLCGTDTSYSTDRQLPAFPQHQLSCKSNKSTSYKHPSENIPTQPSNLQRQSQQSSGMSDRGLSLAIFCGTFSSHTRGGGDVWNWTN